MIRLKEHDALDWGWQVVIEAERRCLALKQHGFMSLCTRLAGLLLSGAAPRIRSGIYIGRRRWSNTPHLHGDGSSRVSAKCVRLAGSV
jgi:hypothetical protein